MLQQIDVDELVTKMVEIDGSDLHLKVGSPPAIRTRGLLQRLEGYEVLRSADTEDMVRDIMTGKVVKAFEEEVEADFSYAVAGVGCFRVNAFRQRGDDLCGHAFHPVWGTQVRGSEPAGGYREAGARRARHNSGHGDLQAAASPRRSRP